MNRFFTTNSIFLLIFILYVAGYVSHSLYLKKTVYGDGVFYYSWLRSVVVDHDIDFRNEYKSLAHSQPPAPSGLPGNKYTVGPALFWATDFIWTHVLTRKSGYEFNYQFFVGLDGVMVAIAGLVLLFRLLRKYYSESVSLLSTFGIAFATNLFFYGSLDTVNSHALSFFAATVFLNILLTDNTKRSFWIGLTLGFAGLSRTQDFIYALALIPYWRSWKDRILLLVLGITIGFLPQLFAWQALYGKFWASPYINPYEGFDVFHPHILEVLFSPKNGLFFWTPIVTLGLIGLLLNKNAKILNAVVLAQIFLVSSWSMWWQGASYSGRMFVSILPLFALGLGHIFTILWKVGWRQNYFLLILLAPLSAINMLYMIYFLLIT